jgi:hypothetical protein
MTFGTGTNVIKHFTDVNCIANGITLVQFASKHAAGEVNYAVKRYITLGTGTNVIKLFTAVNFECSKKVKVFVPGSPLQPRLMYAIKQEPTRVEHL